MIRWIKWILVIVFLFFLGFYIEKFIQYKELARLYELKRDVLALQQANVAIKYELFNIIGNRYVSYDKITQQIKRFMKELRKIEQENFLIKKEQLQKLQKSFIQSVKVIEEIIRTSALTKSSYLYLPTLQRDILLSIKDRALLETIQEIMETLSYEMIAQEGRGCMPQELESLAKRIGRTKSLDSFMQHTKIICQNLAKLQPLKERYEHLYQKLDLQIASIIKELDRYQQNFNKKNILFESLFVVTMLVVLLLLFYFINKEQRFEKQLREIAEHDYLTNLPNRYKLLKDLRALQKKEPFYILKLDLDKFAYFNENFGSVAGDSILKSFANILQNLSPYAYRITADEFAVLVMSEKREDVERVFEELQTRMKEIPYAITTSGAAYLVDGRCDIERLVFYLQAALYCAKNQGGDKLCFYEPNNPFIQEYSRISQYGVSIRKRIEEAIEHDTFLLYLQPILEIKSNQIVKYEALLRMKENGKILYPQEFIEMAEKFNLITPITKRVIHKAFEIVAKEGLELSVNLSALDLGNEELLDFIQKKLKEKGLQAHKVTFEITETAVMEDRQKAFAFLDRLKQMGFSISIDDFGVGYSSLYYLRDIPADFIKIDGVFIKDIDKNEKNREFVAQIIKIVKKSGKKSIAEYVENKKILEILAQIGVDMAQGYYIGKPEPLQQRRESDTKL